jgi:phage/plasmid-associated DNA primase
MEEVSPAMRGRLHLIPFDRRWNRPGHPEHDASLPDGDPKLLEQLRGEAEGVLAWLVAGAVAYNREGLPPPPEVIAATRAYFKEQDAVAGWLDGYGRCPPADGAGAQALHMAFESWCAANGRRSLSAVRFSAALTQARIEWKDTSTGRRYGLRPNAEGALV